MKRIKNLELLIAKIAQSWKEQEITIETITMKSLRKETGEILGATMQHDTQFKLECKKFIK